MSKYQKCNSINVSISKIINTSSSWLLFCIQGRLHHHTWFLNMCHEQPVTEIFVNKPIGGQIIGAQIIGGQIMDGQIIGGQIIGGQTSVTGNLESRWPNDLVSEISDWSTLLCDLCHTLKRASSKSCSQFKISESGFLARNMSQKSRNQLKVEFGYTHFDWQQTILYSWPNS